MNANFAYFDSKFSATKNPFLPLSCGRMQISDQTARRYATFSVESMRFGIDAAEVQEFLVAQGLTAIPLASPVIAGLINLRGQIITAVDMRVRLNLPPRPPGEPSFNIVIRSHKAIRSLQVDEIGDVVELSMDAHEVPSPTLPAQLRSVLRGVCKVNGSLLLILDSGELFPLSPVLPK